MPAGLVLVLVRRAVPRLAGFVTDSGSAGSVIGRGALRIPGAVGGWSVSGRCVCVRSAPVRLCVRCPSSVPLVSGPLLCFDTVRGVRAPSCVLRQYVSGPLLWFETVLVPEARCTTTRSVTSPVRIRVPTQYMHSTSRVSFHLVSRI